MNFLNSLIDTASKLFLSIAIAFALTGIAGGVWFFIVLFDLVPLLVRVIESVTELDPALAAELAEDKRWLELREVSRDGLVAAFSNVMLFACFVGIIVAFVPDALKRWWHRIRTHWDQGDE